MGPMLVASLQRHDDSCLVLRVLSGPHFFWRRPTRLLFCPIWMAHVQMWTKVATFGRFNDAKKMTQRTRPRLGLLLPPVLVRYLSEPNAPSGLSGVMSDNNPFKRAFSRTGYVC